MPTYLHDELGMAVEDEGVSLAIPFFMQGACSILSGFIAGKLMHGEVRNLILSVMGEARAPVDREEEGMVDSLDSGIFWGICNL